MRVRRISSSRRRSVSARALCLTISRGPRRAANRDRPGGRAGLDFVGLSGGCFAAAGGAAQACPIVIINRGPTEHDDSERGVYRFDLEGECQRNLSTRGRYSVT